MYIIRKFLAKAKQSVKSSEKRKNNHLNTIQVDIG